MSKLYEPSFADPLGALIRVHGIGVTLARGTSSPSNSVAGYAKGCLYQDTTNGAVYMNTGSATSSTWVRQDTALDLSSVTATATELNYLDGDLSTNKLTQGSGVDGAEGYHSSIWRMGGLVITHIYINIDDLVGSATDLDIIGESATANCHWGQITTAKSGTIIGGRITCLEVPTGGSADVDFYSSDVATGTQDVIITDAALGTETALVTAGGAWTAAAPVKSMTGLPTANDYIYVVNGAASGGTFTAGKFLIELFGTI